MMPEDLRVSIVIPCFNQAHFLADALASAAAQTRPPDEIIVVDDGSTDATAEVATHHTWAKLIRQQNRGLAAARNAGLHASSGELLVFLDADDRLLPTALQAGIECLAHYPGAAFAFGRFCLINENGSPLAEGPPRRLRPLDSYQAFLEGNYVGMHATVMYRRAALLAAGGFDERLRECEDYDLYLRIARAHQVAAHDNVIAEYRQHEASLSHDFGRMLRTVLHVLEQQRMLIQDDGECVRSFERGRRAWRQYYGERLVKHTLRLARTGCWIEARLALKQFLDVCRGQTLTILAIGCIPERLRRQAARSRAKVAA